MSEFSLELNIVVFFGAALVILFAGIQLAFRADRIADLSGLGEAIVGGLFLGAVTSLPGLIASLTAAVKGHAELAVSAALGGLAIQTAFIAVADIRFTHANLEHSAASLTNIFQGLMLILLLSVPLIATTSPELTIAHVHPASFLLLALYIVGIWLVSEVKDAPMWKPLSTDKTVADVPDERLKESGVPLTREVTGFLIASILVSVSGYVVAETGIAISDQTGLSETLVGGLFIALVTSLPELVTSVAAVHQGSPTLAVGDILGGNSFEIILLALCDLVYVHGSIYSAITNKIMFLLGLALFLIAVLLLGLIRREKHGVFNIGLESLVIIAAYILGMVALSAIEA